MIKWKLILGVLCVGIANAYSYGVDMCYNEPGSPNIIQNCIDLDESCRTSHFQDPILDPVRCRGLALISSLSGLSGSNNIIGARSLIHSDSTYLMAQLIGFTAWQAYQMMIYDEATDQSDYVAYDQAGAQMLTDNEISICRANWGPTMANQCQILTPVMSGIYKFNYNTGGMLLHLHARNSLDTNPPPPVQGDFPNVDYLSVENRPYEELLTNFQAWVFNARYDACSAGITRTNPPPDSPEAACQLSKYILSSPMYFFAPGFSQLVMPFESTLGPLIINENTDNNVIATDASFQPYITPHDVIYAKAGIYFHTLGDRYSHHLCTDNSYFYKEDDGNYTSLYSSVMCAEGSHFLWHGWEQGTDQSDANLDTQYQTMRGGLNAVYDQLVAYATYLKIPLKVVDKDRLINELIEILGTTDAPTRLDHMVDLMETYDALPLPGHGITRSLTIDGWLAAAGAPPLS